MDDLIKLYEEAFQKEREGKYDEAIDLYKILVESGFEEAKTRLEILEKVEDTKNDPQVVLENKQFEESTTLSGLMVFLILVLVVEIGINIFAIIGSIQTQDYSNIFGYIIRIFVGFISIAVFSQIGKLSEKVDKLESQIEKIKDK